MNLAPLTANPQLAEVYNEVLASVQTDATLSTGEAQRSAVQTLVVLANAASKAIGSGATLELPSPTAGIDTMEKAEAALAALASLPPGTATTAGFMERLTMLTHAFTALSAEAQTGTTDAGTTLAAAENIEQQATNITQQLRSLIENSTYPNFTDFLKQLVEVAQQLREQAAELKMAAIENKFNLSMEGVALMKDAAQNSKESRDANIRAEVISASISFATSIVAAGVGMAVKDQAAGGAAAGVINQAGGALGTLAATGEKFDASNKQLAADLANAEKAKYDALAGKADANIQSAADLEAGAKSLREAVQNMIQTLINSHAQIIRSAAEV